MITWLELDGVELWVCARAHTQTLPAHIIGRLGQSSDSPNYNAMQRRVANETKVKQSIAKGNYKVTSSHKVKQWFSSLPLDELHKDCNMG